jgi:GT2 family glycosyltransferase
MSRVFSRHPEVGVVAASMEDKVYGKGNDHNGWRLHGFAGELFAMGPVSRRIFRKFLNYPETYFRGRKAVYVDAVHGSMLMVDAAAFAECGGYDEGIFLYQEEAVLGWRMKTSGYRTVLLLNETYQHEHSVSISQTYKNLAGRQKLRNESTLYYMKHYLFINPLQECLAKLWFQGILMEDWVMGNLENATVRLKKNKDFRRKACKMKKNRIDLP